MDIPFFQKGQKVRIVGREISFWEATAVINTFEFDLKGEISFTFTDWHVTEGWTRYEEGGAGKLSCRAHYLLTIEASPGLVTYTTMGNEEYTIELVE
ncbi:MAG: hypothetical protein O3A36_04010 [bacterium]|nr:hypothetical protein [bacterium]